MSDSTRPDEGRRRKGFEQAANLLRSRIRTAGESRGFAVAKVLTHWDEIAGPEIAAVARPVKVSYAPSGKGQKAGKAGRAQGLDHGFGATLTVLTNGANAPMLEMQKEILRQKVNACYGYNAVSRIQITQTSAQGFAEAQALFRGQKRPGASAANPETDLAARRFTEGVGDDSLREALEHLARSVLSRPGQKEPSE